MPSWKIHIKVAEKICKKIDVDERYFMLGNLLPDQDKFNIPSLEEGIPRSITHFVSPEASMIGINLPDFNGMYDKYKDHFDNPVFLGYFVHLVTDYYWNKYVYDHYYIKENGEFVAVKTHHGEIRCPFRSMNKIKHEDLKKFNRSLEVKKYDFDLKFQKKYFKDLKEIRINQSQIEYIARYLNRQHAPCEVANDYEMLSQEELDRLLISSERFVLKILREKKLIPQADK